MKLENKQFCELPFNSTSLDNLPNEIWVDMIGFDGVFEVSNLGRIKSLSRWVSTSKGGQRLTKEIIRKQSMWKGRLSCNISYNNVPQSLNLPAIFYFSFNTNESSPNRRFCVIHKNKIACDNRLENLSFESVSSSHKLNFKKNLLPHLAENNKKKQEESALIAERKCCKCGVVKSKENFYKNQGNKCISCASILKKIAYENNKINHQSKNE